MMNGKIHRARVTDADLNYVGSISIDPILMKAADIVPNEQVSVYNLNNGSRLETYAIEGDDGQICLNGAAARLAQVGDLVIIVTYVDLEDGELSAIGRRSSSWTRTTARSRWAEPVSVVSRMSGRSLDARREAGCGTGPCGGPWRTWR